MLVQGEYVSLYVLRGSPAGFRPVARLLCGDIVKAVSMDASSGRFAVAVLLRHRVCVIFDLYSGDESLSSTAQEPSVGKQTDIQRPGPRQFRSRVGGQIHTDSAIHTLSSSSGLPTSTLFRPQTIWLKGNRHLTEYLSFLFDSAASDHEFSEMPVRTRPTSLYGGLGSPDDAPRSVAICPQRNCVAIGCRSGIELHWVDAITGEGLNLWIPLALPSDYLYFLPQREGDSNKKLRLVSSASATSSDGSSSSSSGSITREESYTSHRRSSGSSMSRQSMTRLFFGSLPFPIAVRPRHSLIDPLNPDDHRGVLRTIDCDHYCAIPLSDGTHILFTDPASGMVCLGCDAPLGGPTKLLRKAVFPPASQQYSLRGIAASSPPVPRCYSAAPELSWGVRIIVAYSDGSVVLYNVPSDTFERIRHIRSGPDVWNEGSGVTAQSDLAMDLLMERQMYEQEGTGDQSQPHGNSLINPSSANAAATHGAEDPKSAHARFRTLVVTGRLITQIDAEDEGVVANIAVDGSRGGLRVWVFLSEGMAKCFDIYTARDQPVRHFTIDQEGLLKESHEDTNDSTKDESRHDTNMSSATGVNDRGHESDRHVHFDGLDGTLDFSGASGSEGDEIVGVSGYARRVLHRADQEENHIEQTSLEVMADWAGVEMQFRPHVVVLE